jgi:hypothetical protein
MNVAGRKHIVKSAIDFIAAPSFLAAAEICWLIWLSFCAVKLYTWKAVSKQHEFVCKLYHLVSYCDKLALNSFLVKLKIQQKVFTATSKILLLQSKRRFTVKISNARINALIF